MDGMSRHLRDGYWHPLCHRRELANARDFLKFQWLGDEVVVFNDHGHLVAFDNRCPHRGTRIFLDRAGSQSLVCPYHGWSFSHGRVKVANPAGFKECNLAGLALNELRTAWCGEFLFVSRHATHSLGEQLGELAPILESISASIGARKDFDAYDFQCDWRISMENALEPYHVPMVHRGSLGLLQLSEGRNDLIGVNSVWYAELGNARMDRQLRSMRRLFDLRYQFEGYMSIFLFPFSMISSTYGYSYSLQNFFPSDVAQRTHFNSRLFTGTLRQGMDLGVVEEFFESTARMNRDVFAEDHAICRRVPLNSWSARAPRYFSDSEAKLLHFRRSYLSAEHSRPAAGVPHD
jgi:phenylpropionate dioxygenase-like ring-hydroxylating dioxygenase large terminal subunit